MTPVLAVQFAAVVAWFGLAALAIGLFQFLCWMRYRDEPPPPTGCPLPDYISPERAADNEAWLLAHDPDCAALFARWDADDARTGRRQYTLDEARAGLHEDDQPQAVTPQWQPAVRIDWSGGLPRRITS